jgi:hypothetical protein
MSNSYIPPHRRNGSSVDTSNKYTSKDDLLANLGIRQPNNVHFTDRDFSIRVFSDEVTAFPEAERLFMKDADEFKLKKVIIGNETLQHYHLKNSFFDSADLSISYTDKETSGRIIIQFGVSLEDLDIGGSVSYRDIGLVNRASVGAFVSKFPEIVSITGLNNKLVYLINNIAIHYRDELTNAMKREIVEECTPDDANPISVGPLSFVKTKVEKSGKRLNVRYIFKGCEDFKKVREMDIFPMIFEGTLIDVYYTYGTGKKDQDHKYLVNAPYKIDEFGEDAREHLLTVEDLESMSEKSFKKSESNSTLELSNSASNNFALSENNYNSLYNSITNMYSKTNVIDALNKSITNAYTNTSVSAAPSNVVVMPPIMNKSSRPMRSEKPKPSVAFGYKPKTIHFNRTARNSSKSRTNSTRKNRN